MKQIANERRIVAELGLKMAAQHLKRACGPNCAVPRPDGPFAQDFRASSPTFTADELAAAALGMMDARNPLLRAEKARRSHFLT
jgi:hypothetical protein